MSRREFTKKQKEQIVERAMRNGVICCEGCGLVLAGKPHEIDHIVPEALRPTIDKQKPLAIAEGQLLGRDCCHRGASGKTARDITQTAKAKRQAHKHLRIVDAPKMQGQPMPTTRKAYQRKQKAASKLPLPAWKRRIIMPKEAAHDDA